MCAFAGLARRHGRPIPTRFLAAAAAVALALAAAAPASPPPRPPEAAQLDLVVAVKAAIAADPELRGANLLVSVMDGVAVVGGPVPSEAAAARLEGILGRVPGLTAARVSCWVQVPDDPLKKLVADRVRAGTTVPVAPPAPAVEPLAPPPFHPAPPDPRPAGTVV